MGSTLSELETKSASLFERVTITLGYFFAGLGSSFLFWWGLLFDFSLADKIGLISASLTLVFVAWISDRKIRSGPLMGYTRWAFVGGGTTSAVAVWLFFLWLLLLISIFASEY